MTFELSLRSLYFICLALFIACLCITSLLILHRARIFRRIQVPVPSKHRPDK